jgi:hypothetical protein
MCLGNLRTCRCQQRIVETDAPRSRSSDGLRSFAHWPRVRSDSRSPAQPDAINGVATSPAPARSTEWPRARPVVREERRNHLQHTSPNLSARQAPRTWTGVPMTSRPEAASVSVAHATSAGTDGPCPARRRPGRCDLTAELDVGPGPKGAIEVTMKCCAW